MTRSADVVSRFLKEKGWTIRRLSVAAQVDETIFSHVLCGRRARFSPATAEKIHRVAPRMLPLRELLGLTK